MRLRTIWTIPAMSLTERLRRTRDALTLSAAHRLPRRLAYWSLVDTGARHMKADEEVPAVTYMDVLERAGEGVSLS